MQKEEPTLFVGEIEVVVNTVGNGERKGKLAAVQQRAGISKCGNNYQRWIFSDPSLALSSGRLGEPFSCRESEGGLDYKVILVLLSGRVGS